MSSNPTIVYPFTIPIHLGRFQFELSGFGVAVLLADAGGELLLAEAALAARLDDDVSEAHGVGRVLLRLPEFSGYAD